MDNSVRKALLLAASLSVLSGCASESGKSIDTPQKIELSARVQSLQQIPGWISLKELWQTLDAIPPKDSANFGGAYMGTLGFEKAQEYRKKLQEIRVQLGYSNKGINLSSLLQKNDAQNKKILNNREKRAAHLSDLEVTILCDLVEYRISMFVNGPASMYTRMIIHPSSPRIFKEKTVEALEKQIDLILTLKAQKKLSEEEYTKALKSIQESIYQYAVGTIIQDGYNWSHSLTFSIPTFSEKPPIEKIEAQLDAHYQQIMEILAKPTVSLADEKSYNGYIQKYNRTKENLKTLKENLPALEELIAELQR